MGRHHIFLWILLLSAAPGARGFCPQGCRCDDLRLKVQCTNSTLDVLPIALNTRIEHIKMSFNKIRIVDASFQFYEHLIEIDLSFNIIEDIEDKSFAAQKYLIKLDLSHNKIQDLNPKVFIGLLRLNYLSLRANELEFIRPGVLEHLISLISLDLGGNKISQLEPEVFIANHNLEVLVLDFNQLSEVPAEALSRCQKITSLDLSNNNLSNYKNQQFNIFPFIKQLNLSSCSLTGLSETSMKNLSRLTSLDLSNNELKTVPSSELASLSMLRKLDLSGNMFPSLGPHSFRELHKLQQLYLSNLSHLRQIQVAAFHNNLDLRVVDLSDNYMLEAIQPHAFPRILHLTHLSLASSGLSSLKSESVPWERLTYLDLTNVSLHCTCELAWLLKVNVHGAVCSLPEALRGSAVKSVRLSGLGCGQGLQTEVLVVGLGCVVLITLVLIVSALGCLCRQKLRHFITTCSVSASETTYKNSYDNCVYLGKMTNYVPDENEKIQEQRQRLVPNTLTYKRESEDSNQFKPLCIEATPL